MWISMICSGSPRLSILRLRASSANRPSLKALWVASMVGGNERCPQLEDWGF